MKLVKPNHSKVLAELKQKLEWYKNNYKLNFDIIEGVGSHYKEVLEEARTPEGILTIAAIYFTGESYTGLHVHPEYIVDEVIHGEMTEKLYQFKGEQLIFCEDVIRPLGHQIINYCPKGAPHNVIANGGPCVTLNITLGENPLRYITKLAC